MHKNDPAINPHFGGSATSEDIRPGVALLRVFSSGHINTTVVESLPLEGWRVHLAARETALCLFPPRPGGHDQWFLDRCGIVPYPDGRWVDDCVTIVNTANNRGWLIQWLLDKDKQHADGAACELVLQYCPDADHTTLRKMIARLMKHKH